MEHTGKEWLRARADHHRSTITEIQRQIDLMQEADFSLREPNAESSDDLDITHQVIAHERQLIVELQRVIGFIESKLQTER